MSTDFTSNPTSIARELFDACNAFKEDDSQWQRAAVAIQAARDEIERLMRERDEWAAKWHRARAELAELKYPGMKGVIRPKDSPNETGERHG